MFIYRKNTRINNVNLPGNIFKKRVDTTVERIPLLTGQCSILIKICMHYNDLFINSDQIVQSFLQY